jgi:polysaccharide export outer membrane protein
MTRRFFAALLGCVLAGLLASCALISPAPVARPAAIAPQDSGPPLTREASYRVRQGDRLNVFVFDNPDLAQTITVGPDGRTSFPLVGSFKAEGMTLAGVDAHLTGRLKENVLEPDVTVTLAELALSRIYVLGEVTAPGTFDISTPVSVVQALSMAGGFTAFARRDNIVVYNPTAPRFGRRGFDYDAFLANPAGSDFALGPGDTVIVP